MGFGNAPDVKKSLHQTPITLIKMIENKKMDKMYGIGCGNTLNKIEKLIPLMEETLEKINNPYHLLLIREKFK